MLQYLRLSPKTEANIFAAGLTSIFFLGSVTLVVALIAVIWLAFQAIMLMLLSIVEVASMIGTLYGGADPLVRLLVICVVGTAVYRIARKAWRKA